MHSNFLQTIYAMYKTEFQSFGFEILIAFEGNRCQAGYKNRQPLSLLVSPTHPVSPARVTG
ncbi:MAG TPA: hypothetical protein DCG57_13955 [Candidatus Riflebacteria bacterium]|jgi:hypothetical protein|nr:hypothetical protein [Candidatus Riflebacteria bacterium]